MHILSIVPGPGHPAPWVWVGTGIHLIAFALVCIHSISHRRQANSAILWIFLAWSLPIVGPLLYLFIGVDRVPAQAFRKREVDADFLEDMRKRQSERPPLAYWRAVHETGIVEPDSEAGRKLNRMLEPVLSHHPLLGGNEIMPLVSGDEAYPQMFDAIRSARHHVHVQSFIISRDRVGRDLMTLLHERAEQGVQVRVMYDRFGSTAAHLSGFFLKYRHPNMQITGWTQANPLRRQFQINLRNHRKTLVVDGAQAFCGGINFHEDNMSHGARKPIRDYHFMVRGPIVQELQFSFLRDWHFMTGEDPDRILTETFFPHIEPQGNSKIRLVNSGPATSREAIADVLFMSIVRARSEVLVVTPYFVPTPDIVRALRSAALRGVNVRLVVPEKNNHFYAGWAGRSYYEELLEAGVRIFEREPPFMHAKAILVDNCFSMVGTANIDVRSLRLNYETNLIIYDEAFVDTMDRIIFEDISRSREIDLSSWRRRPRLWRALENVAYLLIPML